MMRRVDEYGGMGGKGGLDEYGGMGRLDEYGGMGGLDEYK